MVELPAYFEALTTEVGRAVLLTPVLADGTRRRPGRRKARRKREGGDPSPPEAGIPQVAATYPRDGAFTIRAGGTYPEEFEVSWLVKAIRSDVPALFVEPLRTEVTVMGEAPYRYYLAAS